MQQKLVTLLMFLSVFASQSVYATHSETEPNDTMGAADPYILGIPMDGQISHGEQDWFYFETLVDHLFLDISRKGEHVILEVFNSAGELLFSGGAGESQSANIGLELADTYFILIRGHNSEYEFTARLSDEPTCDNCQETRGNNATFDPRTGQLFIRIVDVLDIYGGRVPYEVELKQITPKYKDEPLKFEVVKALRIFKKD